MTFVYPMDQIFVNVMVPDEEFIEIFDYSPPVIILTGVVIASYPYICISSFYRNLKTKKIVVVASDGKSN